MTQNDQLADLHAITKARYQQQQQRFQELVGEEMRLRGDIARLDQMQRQAIERADQAGEMRAIGADLLWQGWVGRAKTEINLKLARVLALKLHHIEQVRKAFGKVLVIEELMDKAHSDANRKTAQDMLSRAVSHAVFR
jgi:hypothetical protein